MTWIPPNRASDRCPELAADEEIALVSDDPQYRALMAITTAPVHDLARTDLATLLREAQAPIYMTMHAPGSYCLYSATDSAPRIVQDTAHVYGLPLSMRGRAQLPTGVLLLSGHQAIAPIPHTAAWYIVGSWEAAERHLRVVQYYAIQAQAVWDNNPSSATGISHPPLGGDSAAPDASLAQSAMAPFLEWLQADPMAEGNPALHDTIVDLLAYNTRDDRGARLAWYDANRQQIFYSPRFVQLVEQGEYQIAASALLHESIHWQSSLLPSVKPVRVLVAAGVSVFSRTVCRSGEVCAGQLPPWEEHRMAHAVRPIDCAEELLAYAAERADLDRLPPDIQVSVGAWIDASEDRLIAEARKVPAPQDLWGLASDHLHRGLASFLDADALVSQMDTARERYSRCTGQSF